MYPMRSYGWARVAPRGPPGRTPPPTRAVHGGAIAGAGGLLLSGVTPRLRLRQERRVAGLSAESGPQGILEEYSGPPCLPRPVSAASKDQDVCPARPSR